MQLLGIMHECMAVKIMKANYNLEQNRAIFCLTKYFSSPAYFNVLRKCVFSHAPISKLDEKLKSDQIY